MKSLKLSNYFEVVNPSYVFYKLTPLKSLRNYSSDKILNIVATLYKKLTARIIKQNKKYFFKVPVKLSYYIYMKKDIIEFYFIIPTEYKTLFIDKIGDVWKGITIKEIDNIPLFSKQSIKYCMNYKKRDAFSLTTDKRNNVLLTSLSSCLSVLEQNDKIGILYNFIPQSQYYWKADFDYILKKYKKGYPVEQNKTNIKYVIKILAKILCDIIEFFLNSITTDKISPPKTASNILPVSPETTKKRNLPIIKTQIIVISESKDKQKAEHNAISVCQAFDVLAKDNNLKYHQFNSKFKPTDYKIKYADTMQMSSLECQNFVSLPAKSLIEEHNIECINVFESEVPKKLQDGVVNIGKSTFRGNKQNVYLCNDKELRNLSLCITGSNRSGKTTLLSNILDNYLSANECCILLDFCGKCELSEYMKKLFKGKVLNIQCDNYETMQGMGFNEVNIDEIDIFKQYANAKLQSVQLSTLLNIVNEEDKTLKAKMDRFLECASLICFINGGNIQDVFNVLQNYKTRKEFINKIPEQQKENLEEYIMGLQELDEKNKEGKVVGTRYNLICGIIDRLNALRKNPYIELMLKKSCENNINLLNEIQKSQLICIKMPEAMFSTSQEKDIFCSYWFSKIWLALQLRKNNTPREKHMKINIIIDEIYQVEHCQQLVSKKLSQLPKFTAKLITTCHYLDQIPVLRNELKASNASYMILQGSNVKNYDSLKQEFSNLNYHVDDLLNLQRYNSLNLLSYENGYWAGVTKLPPPRENFTT